MEEEHFEYKNGWDFFEHAYHDEETITFPRQYSQYADSTQNTIKKYTRSILRVLSGGDVIALLRDLLSKDDVAKMHPFDKVSVSLFS